MKFNKLLKESQFHGGRRLAEKNCRWCWSIAMLVFFGSAVAVIIATVNRFLDNPTFMVQLETVENSMDFPSVIVCPEIFFREDNVNKFLSDVVIPPNLNRSYLEGVIFQLGAFFSVDISYKADDLENIQRLLEFNNMTLDTAGRLLTTSCEETLIRCRWQGVIVKCTNIFHMELTGDGYCCVFNGRSLNRDVRPGNHYRKWHTESFGFDSGMMIVVNQSQDPIDVDLSYKWLALQSTRHYIEPTLNGTALNPGYEHWVEYHIRNFQIAEFARSLSHTLRKCRMAYEPLTFFPLYHKRYCVLECELMHTLKRCNCVRPVHPCPKGVSYCNARQLQCAKHTMVSYDSDECDCPSACDVATDFVKVSSFVLQSNVRPVDMFYDGLDFEKVTIVRAFVFSRKVKTDSRWSYFNNIDLFAQLGGVFNVFFGCSILTILELGILAYHGVKTKMSAFKAQDKPQRRKNKSKKSGKVNSKNLKSGLNIY